MGRRLRFSSDADIVRLTNARIIIIIIIIRFCRLAELKLNQLKEFGLNGDIHSAVIYCVKRACHNSCTHFCFLQKC